MFIIEFEGLDKSGKRTQTELLKEELEREGFRVKTTSFHRYDTPTGKLIRDWLYGSYKVSEETIKLIMTADKQAQQDYFKQLEKEYDVLICDRYLLSNICYRRDDLDYEWLQTIQTKLRKPDATVFIDITPQESMERKGEHGVNDLYERDKKLLEVTRENYHKELKKLESVKGYKTLVITDADRLNKTQLSLRISKTVKSWGIVRRESYGE